MLRNDVAENDAGFCRGLMKIKMQKNIDNEVD